MRVGIEYLTVDSYFLVPKTYEELLPNLQEAGLTLETYFQLSGEERKKLGWDEHLVSANGTFTFPVDRQVLAHTAEDVMIADDREYRMHDYFIDKDTGLSLPLTTNLTAPNLKPLSQGPQTYEIRNVSGNPLTIAIDRLKCVVDVLPLDHPYVPSKETRGQFQRQTRGVIALGSLVA